MHGLLACMRFAEEEMVCFDSAPAAMVITRTVVERLSGLFRPGGLHKPVRMRFYRAMGFSWCSMLNMSIIESVGLELHRCLGFVGLFVQCTMCITVIFCYTVSLARGQPI